MKRRFHPDILARLELEAEAISTAVSETIRKSHQRARAVVDHWEPAPCPKDWT